MPGNEEVGSTFGFSDNRDKFFLAERTYNPLSIAGFAQQMDDFVGSLNVSSM